jgi:hypothetical protein
MRELGVSCHSTCLHRQQWALMARHVLYTVIIFVSTRAKFGTCTVVGVNGALVEAKMCTFTLECTHFIFNKCPIYTHDGASANLELTHTKRMTVYA